MVQSKSLGTLSSEENLVTDCLPESEALNGNIHGAETSNRSASTEASDRSTSTETSNYQVVPKGRQRKRSRDETNGVDALPRRRMPRRAASCSDFKEKATCMPDENDALVVVKRAPIVDGEIAAISLTICQDIPPSESSTRRLSDFTFHDVSGKLQPVEMLQVTDLFITGLIHPSKPDADKRKENGVRCKCFGRIESWRISGYEDGLPVIWVSTKIADYECIKPATSYKKTFGHIFEKAHASVQVYRTLSKYSGGDLNVGLHELLASVVRSMKGSKNFSPGVSIKDFLISQGDFIYNQLSGLDTMSKNSDQKFSGLPVLIALQEESKNVTGFVPEKRASSINIGDAENANLSDTAEEDEDAKMARLWQEEEDWRSMNKRKKGRVERNPSKYYIMMKEDEIAADYPLPAYYKPSSDETDEYIIFDDISLYHSDQLPKNMLHDWSLYNSDSRLVSLELLPMKPCGEIDFAIFGSGIMTEDIGSGFCLDDDYVQSSTSAGLESADGIPLYLSEIKEWMIEFGASMVFISIRTDLAWYRLGKPSKQYAPWYETVLRTARLSISIITLLKEQSRVARLSVKEVIKRLSEFEKNHPAFISSYPTAVERYVVVHGQIILQQFAEYPDNSIRRCPFVSGLQIKMEERHHTKCLVKKKAVTKKGINLNPRATMGPVMKKQLLPATTTRLINRIWGEFYSNYSPEDSESTVISESEVILEEQDEDAEEDLEEQDDDVPVLETLKSHPTVRGNKLHGSGQGINWVDGQMQNSCASEILYKKADVHGHLVAVGSCVSVETNDSEGLSIYFVEYMDEKSDGRKMGHGRLMLRGSQTVLGNVANERELFLTNNCLDFDLKDIKESVVVEIKPLPWGFHHRKNNAENEKRDRARAEERKIKGLPIEYYARSLYCPENGAFLVLPSDAMGIGNGICHACKTKKTEKENSSFKMNSSNTGFMYLGTNYNLLDFVYVAPRQFAEDEREGETFKGGRNVGLKPYIICQLLKIDMPKGSRQVNPQSVKIKARRFFRPDDISEEKAYRSHICEVYFSEHECVLTLAAIQGKCEVKKKHEFLSLAYPFVHEHVFFCEHLYDPDSGALKQLPTYVKLSSSNVKLSDDSASRKNKGKVKEGETEVTILEELLKNKLATLDIFAGCGGLSEGLHQSGVSLTKWAIEYEEPAGEAFNHNHPESMVFINNCNVILRAIMSACGDGDDCISTPETSELAEKLDCEVIRKLPRPGQVDFINGGPPCQGFSGMNRFNRSAWSKVQCEMILAFLSFVDYFRPKYFLLENVRNFVSFNKGQTFRLTIASLLEMGYQVRFGILEAGAFGVSQSRKRAFIWAASPQETLPEWPEPMHVFAGPELKVTLDSNHQHAAVRSTASGAPFRSITVRDTIGDLPDVKNGASITPMEYKNDSVSWYQKMIRGDTMTLTDHISKEMNELNLIRCQRIPKRPGSDWRDLPEEKVRLSTGQMVDLIPWCLPNTADRHNQWKGLFGRLDWEGNFPTSITDPQPMGKVGMCFHPDQDRIVTVRECARSQGFPDGYKLAGNIQHRYRQIGNAVPPPLAFALGRKLKEVIKRST